MNFQHKEKIDHWRKLYDQIYAIGTVYANQNPRRQNESDTIVDPVQLPNFHIDIDLERLRLDYGPASLKCAVWGATYSSALYDFLRQLEWDQNTSQVTQWLEI